jgi:DNA invertase Pin-like site-specific DNA recombinase
MGVEAHHLYLKSEGCTDNLTVWLCSECHGRAHDMERRVNISAATRRGLAGAKARGVKLGGFRGVAPPESARVMARAAIQARVKSRAEDLAPVVKELQASGATSLGAIAKGLNARGIPTATGCDWSATEASRLLKVIARL